MEAIVDQLFEELLTETLLTDRVAVNAGVGDDDEVQ